MEKFVVTFVDGTQCVCYRNKDQGRPFPLVTDLLVDPLEQALGRLRPCSRLAEVGVSNPDTPVGSLSVSHLPRCYLNTEPGRDRLRLLAALAYGRYCRQRLEN